MIDVLCVNHCSQISGAERWAVKTFYAADSGINLAQSRARVQALEAFARSARKAK